MGLPVWRAPSPEPRSRDRDALKADTTGQRSPIRRRQRPNRSPRSPSRFDGDLLWSASRFASHLDAAARPTSSRPRYPPPPVPELRNFARSGEPVANAPTLHRDESSVRRSRSRFYGFLPPDDAPASFGSEDRPLPAFTLNFAPAAASRNNTSRPGHERASRDRSAAYTRSPYRRVAARSRSPWADRATSGTGDNVVIVDEGDDSSDNAVGFPPLRRMGRRTIADGPLPSSSLRESWSPTTTLDGLGDRERSISPFHESPFWDAFLGGTIVPDPLAPTADSSFTSAAASASFSNDSNSFPSSRAGSSNSTSASSSRTHLTVPSRRDSLPSDQFMRACDTSEDDTASDTEEEDFSSFRRRNRREFPAEGPPSRNSNNYSRRVLERSRTASSYVRSFYQPSLPRDSERRSERPTSEQPDGPAEEPTTGDDDGLPDDHDFRAARALLEQLSQRDDIGDEFWASVGLTRRLADPVERLQQRDRL